MPVVLSKVAQKQYLKLPRTAQTRIKKRLLALEENPLLGKKLSGQLKDTYSLRAWPYRIIYEVNKPTKQIEISAILHKQEAYK